MLIGLAKRITENHDVIHVPDRLLSSEGVAQLASMITRHFGECHFGGREHFSIFWEGCETGSSVCFLFLAFVP